MRFLSPEWLAAVDAALRDDPEVAAATRGVSLRLLQRVTGAPDGAVAYVVAVDHGTARVTPAGPEEAADVTFTSDYETAAAIASGRLAAHDAFTTGRLVVRGDLDALRAGAPALAGLSGGGLAAVRASTTY